MLRSLAFHHEGTKGTKSLAPLQGALRARKSFVPFVPSW